MDPSRRSHSREIRYNKEGMLDFHSPQFICKRPQADGADEGLGMEGGKRGRWMGRRTGGRTDGRTCGRVEERTRMEKWTSRQANE